MAKLFIGIALAVMLATAALGFLAKGNIDKLQSSLKGMKGDLDAKKSQLTKAEGDKKKAEDELIAANAKAEAAVKDLDDAKKAADDAKKNAEEAKLVVGTKETEITDLKEKLAKAMGQPTTAPLEDPRVKELEAQLQKASTELAEAKQVSESMSGRVKDAESKTSAAEQKIKMMQAGAVRAGLQGRILAVNSGWNFVVLSVGDKQGVVVNAPLLVVRGNEPIARLRITSVEPSTSIADVIPGSVRRGSTVQPGDTVIFEGRSPVTQAPKVPAPSSDSPIAAPLPN